MATWMQYPITQGFGPTAEPLDSGGFNKGYDYATPMGTPIEALVGGTVISAGDSGDGWGLSVKVQDEYGNTHNYGHLSEINVRPGQQVGGDMLLGLSGNSGKSTGPHLSYDVWGADGGYIDPAEYLGGSGGGGGAMP
jgi:murein DD-endopeptidase MepM/ murein hydrolase activator NlpD